MRSISNTNDAIEAYTDVYSLLIAAAGGVATTAQLNGYREALRTLVALARNEYMVSIQRDMVQASKALK